LGLQVSIRSIQHTDYIRNNPEEVIGGADIQLLIDQVNKFMLPGGDNSCFTTRI
jgi:hypothetical protein